MPFLKKETTLVDDCKLRKYLWRKRSQCTLDEVHMCKSTSPFSAGGGMEFIQSIHEYTHFWENIFF